MHITHCRLLTGNAFPGGETSKGFWSGIINRPYRQGLSINSISGRVCPICGATAPLTWEEIRWSKQRNAGGSSAKRRKCNQSSITAYPDPISLRMVCSRPGSPAAERPRYRVDLTSFLGFGPGESWCLSPIDWLSITASAPQEILPGKSRNSLSSGSILLSALVLVKISDELSPRTDFRSGRAAKLRPKFRISRDSQSDGIAYLQK